MPPITYLSLYRKYGGNIMRANSLEMQAAARAAGETNKLQAMREAGIAWAEEVAADARRNGKVPNICMNRHNLCEDEKCMCW